jgi:hypothetical protein
MKTPTWLRPAIIGAFAGAIVTALVGFNYGGWVSGNSAERMATQRASAAVTAALVPVCLSQAKMDPDAMAKLAQLSALKLSYERREFVMKTGWATAPAAEAPNGDVATACAEVLSKVTPS